MQRRDFFTRVLAGLTVLKLETASAQQPSAGPFLERPTAGTPHRGKVLAAIQPHSDDLALLCAGTVAKLIQEGYTGYMIRATNDDMGDDVGEPGTVGENVLRNEREVAEQARVLGLKRDFALNYNNHRMSDISRNELICRLIFLFRFLKVDTVFCYDPWGHDEENPDHYVLGHCVEAASWMAGRVHDYPEQLAAGLQARAVTEKYYYVRHPDIKKKSMPTSAMWPRVRAAITGRSCGLSWPGRGKNCHFWETTMSPPTATISGSSSWRGIANWGKNTASSTRKLSTTWGRRQPLLGDRDQPSTTTLSNMRCR
jgi:LmbE family N-acetylglucosaminyl deacetylase